MVHTQTQSAKYTFTLVFYPIVALAILCLLGYLAKIQYEQNVANSVVLLTKEKFSGQNNKYSSTIEIVSANKITAAICKKSKKSSCGHKAYNELFILNPRTGNLTNVNYLADNNISGNKSLIDISSTVAKETGFSSSTFTVGSKMQNATAAKSRYRFLNNTFPIINSINFSIKAGTLSAKSFELSGYYTVLGWSTENER